MSAETDATSGGATRPAREWPAPATHGCRVAYHYDDAALYDAARSLWYTEIGEAGAGPAEVATISPDYLDGEYVLLLSSSRWKAGTGTGDDYTPWYQYNLKLRERVDSDGDLTYEVPPISLSVDLLPQAEELVYPDGNDLSLAHGEGTKIEVQTTYPDGPNDVLLRATEALTQALGEAFDPGQTRPDTARITKLEAHIRFDVDKKPAAMKALDHSRDLIGWGGDATVDARQQRTREGWLEASLQSDRWDVLGFEERAYATFGKVYQTQNWQDRPEASPFHHPKLEFAYAGGADTHPHLDAWEEVLAGLRRKVCVHAELAGITPADLIPDPHYDGAGEPTITYAPLPEGRHDDLRAYYESLEAEVRQHLAPRDAAHDVLAVVARNAGASYDTLVEETGLARRTVRYHVRNFAEAGLLKRVGNPVTVVFAAEYLLDRVVDALEAEHAGETAAERRERLQERAEERRERREESEAGEDGPAEESAEEPAQDGERDRWAYLSDLPELSPVGLSDALVTGPMDGEDVRVRVRTVPPDGG